MNSQKGKFSEKSHFRIKSQRWCLLSLIVSVWLSPSPSLILRITVLGYGARHSLLLLLFFFLFSSFFYFFLKGISRNSDRSMFQWGKLKYFFFLSVCSWKYREKCFHVTLLALYPGLCSGSAQPKPGGSARESGDGTGSPGPLLQLLLR